MKTTPMELWLVTFDGKSVQVPAQDKLQATHRGAVLLGVRWRETAAQMDVLRLRKASQRDMAAYEKERGTHDEAD